MDNEYIITSDGELVSTDELAHHGIFGMRWGRRRYQNEDGSLTAAGRERYGVGDGESDGKSGTGRSERDGKSTSTSKAKSSSSKENDNKKQQANKTVEGKTSLRPKPLGEISDSNLNARLKRLENEKKYNDLMAERGYVQVSQFTDMDVSIATLKREKEYKTLKSDIRKLDKEAAAAEKDANTSTAKKFMNATVTKIVNPAVEAAAKDTLTNSLKKVGDELVTKKIASALAKKGVEATNEQIDGAVGKTASALADKLIPKLKKAETYYKKEKKKQDAKEQAKERTKFADRVKNMQSEFTFDDDDDSSSSKGESLFSRVGRAYADGKTKQAAKNAAFNQRVKNMQSEFTFDDDDDSSSSSSTIALGQRKIAGLLPAPSSSSSDSSSSTFSSSTIALGQRKIAGLLSAPSSSSSSTSSSSTIALGQRVIAGLLPAPSSSSSSSSKKFTTSITRNATGTAARVKALNASGNYTNAEIADKLGISIGTLNNYLYGGGN